jgi:hypothetical protein
MTTINDGGPAFPIADVPYPNGNVQPGWNGMTLRDWFAGQALAGLCANPSINMGSHATAEAAYLSADAMFIAREPMP